MINISLSATLLGGTAPYSYTWSADSNCVTFSTATGTSSTSTINVVAKFTDESCITSSTITLSVVDADGCTKSKTMTATNPCTSLTLANISNSGLEFSTSAASTGCSSVDFNWSYDTSLFSQASLVNTATTSVLTLDYLSTASLPSSTSVSVTAKDCKNCTKTKTFTKSICVPQAPDLTVVLVKDQLGINYSSGQVQFTNPSNCAGYSYDWTTVNFSLPSSWSYSWAGGVPSSPSTAEPKFIFGAPSTTTTSLHTGTYTVKSTDGITSTAGTINFVVRVENLYQIGAKDKTIYMDCGVSPTDVIQINIENEIVYTTGATIDWSSFQAVTPPATTGSIALSTLTNGDHVIEYTVPSPVVDETFA